MSDNTFDYIIVGGGTAGSLLANRLSADARKRVLLIEAGRKDDYHWVHIPVGYLYCIGNPRTDWLYQTEPAAGLNGRTLRYPRGKVLGGCSSINGMIYMRGQSRDYEQWATITGDEAWRWDNTLPYFQLHEDHYKGISALHGAKGAKTLCSMPTCPKAATCTHCAGAVRVANGVWTGSVCAGRCWTPLPRPRSRRALRPQTISTRATTRVWAISKSTRKQVGAGTPPRLFCGPPAMAARTLNSGPRPRSASC
jgi:choline dehydrogenase-like flavoprotein